MRLIIYAPSIHAGGGNTLLQALLRAAELPSERRGWGEVVAILDRRFRLGVEVDPKIEILGRASPGLSGRYQAERLLVKVARKGDVVLCFGNLPPLFRIPALVVTYVQNTYTIAIDSTTPLAWTSRLKCWFIRKWFRMTWGHSDLFAVQTVSIRDRLARQLGMERKRILLAPFVSDLFTGTARGRDPSPKRWDFGYISLPWSHKNHRRLIEAFVMLAEVGVTPSLVVTVPKEMDSNLVEWIDRAKKDHSVRITNLGRVPHEEIGELYKATEAFIFPSLTESLPLPLLEAKAFGLPIVAAERDYVRDVVVPSESFDPESPRSIARAVLRFLGSPEQAVLPVGPERFLCEMARDCSIPIHDRQRRG